MLWNNQSLIYAASAEQKGAKRNWKPGKPGLYQEIKDIVAHGRIAWKSHYYIRFLRKRNTEKDLQRKCNVNY